MQADVARCDLGANKSKNGANKKDTSSFPLFCSLGSGARHPSSQLEYLTNLPSLRS
jgi:hypothetical protein